MEKWMKKLILFVAVFALTVLSACSNDKNEPVTTATASPSQNPVEKKKDPVTIRVAVWNDNDKGNIQPVADAFHAKYPHITVNLEALNSADPIGKISTMAAAGDLADVISIHDVFVKKFALDGILEPIDNAMKVNNINVDDIFPAMLKLGQVDGKTYVMPREYDHLVTYVNTTILKNAGIELPKKDWTWEEAVSIMKKVSKKDSAGNVVQLGGDLEYLWEAVWGPFALSQGGVYIDAANKKINFSNPKVVQGLKSILDLSKEGYISNDRVKPPVLAKFNEGKAAFTFSVAPGIRAINDASKQLGFDWEVLPFPRFADKHVVGAGTTGFGLYIKSKHMEEAGAFISFFATKEGQEALTAGGTGIPLLKSLGQGQWREKLLPGVKKNWDAFVDSPEADVVTLLNEVPNDVAEMARGKLAEAITLYMNNESSLEDALKKVDESANALWK